MAAKRKPTAANKKAPATKPKAAASPRAKTKPIAKSAAKSSANKPTAKRPAATKPTPKPSAKKPAATKPTPKRRAAKQKRRTANQVIATQTAKKAAAKKPTASRVSAPLINLLGVDAAFRSNKPAAIELGSGELALDHELGGVVSTEVEAEAALEAGNLDRAIAIYTHLIDSSASPIASSLVARGRAFYRAGDHDRAIADFQRGLELEPQHPDLYFDKGKAELQAGLVADAEVSFTRDIELDPSPISFYNRHLARKALGDADGALSDLDAAIDGMPDEPALRISRALMRHADDDHAGAFEDADLAASLDPDDLMHLDLCGRFALIVGYDARAAEAYDTALKLADVIGDPPNPQHLHGYALALAGLGRAPDAVPFFDRALALAPRDPSFLTNRGWTLHLLGRDTEALADLDAALAADPSYAQALRNRASIYVAQGDRNRALADYRTLDQLGHDVTDAIARLVSP